MNRMHRFSELSVPRQALVRLCQRLNFGEIRDLLVSNSQPVPDSWTVLVDQKLDADQGSRPEHGLEDFALCEEVSRLMFRLDEIGNGRIERIEVRSGIPRRIVFEVAMKSESR